MTAPPINKMMVKGRRGMNGAMPHDTGEVQGLRIGYKFMKIQ